MKITSLTGADGGYARRMAVYFNEMFPLRERLLHSALLATSFVCALALTQQDQMTVRLLNLTQATAAVFGLALILRLMDELKDREIDQRLFASRPLPSGRVRERDIRVSLVTVILVYPLTQLSTSATFVGSLGLLAYSLLMYRHFFVRETLKRRLPIALATHNPVVVLLLIHLAIVAGGSADGVCDVLLDRSFPVLILTYWGLLLAWELARKIRYPAEETEYVTYSRLLGWRCAACIVWLIHTASLLGGLWLFAEYSLSSLYALLIGTSYMWAVYSHVRFQKGRLASGCLLRDTAERFACGMMAASILELALREVTNHA